MEKIYKYKGIWKSKEEVSRESKMLNNLIDKL